MVGIAISTALARTSAPRFPPPPTDVVVDDVVVVVFPTPCLACLAG
jgi:hypothetical protein